MEKTWNMSHRQFVFFFFFLFHNHLFVWLFLTLQILANVIIFTCGNLAGAYHKHLMDLALRQTYQDTCNCIKSPIKLEFEKYQQVPKREKKGQQTVSHISCRNMCLQFSRLCWFGFWWSCCSLYCFGAVSK